MSDVRYHQVSIEEDGQRLDNFLIRILKGVPKSHIYRIIRGGEVRVNKKRAAASTRIASADLIRIPPVRMAGPKETVVGRSLEELLNKAVLFEDNEFLIINKPAGIAVHGGSGLSLGVIEALRKIRTDLHFLELAHRLDRETSGCLLLAKKRSALRAVQRLFAERQINKTYWALLAHPWDGTKTWQVDVPLQKNILKSGERMVVTSPDGKPSQTGFRLLENYLRACWVEAKPETGRTHQIRVHSASMGHPILGDEKYGSQARPVLLNENKHRLFLHARAIEFQLNGKLYRQEAVPDTRFEQCIKQLRAELD